MADEAVVFFSPSALQIKKMKPISEEQIAHAFQHNNLTVYTDPRQFQEFLKGSKLHRHSPIADEFGKLWGFEL